MKENSKNNNVAEQQAEILSKRILPKTDFLKVIEQDKLYYNTLNRALEYNIIKQDILGKKCSVILKNQTRQLITKNINNLTEYAETQIRVLDLKAQTNIQQQLIEDKELHFENVFMPQFKKEVEDCNKNLNNCFKDVKKILQDDSKEMKTIVDKIKFELKWWDKVDEKNQKNDEYKVNIYKPLKRLITNYYDTKSQMEEEKQFTKKVKN